MVDGKQFYMETQNSYYVNREYKDCLLRIAFREKEDLLLPFPQYYILYNGREKEADQCTIELEDAFPDMDGLEPCLKCTATLLNINYGHNREIMEQCKTLNDYAVFVQRLRDNQDLGMELGDAVEKTVEDCINEGILKNILIKNRAEVKDMVLGVWGTELHLRKVREERERMEQQKEEMEYQREEMEHQREEIEYQKEQIEKLEQRTAAVNLLTQKLLQAGMLDVLERASRDEAYQTKLLEEYGLLNK